MNDDLEYASVKFACSRKVCASRMLTWIEKYG